MTKDKRFLVVGLGLMGGSYAMGLSKAGFAVDGLDEDHATLEYALANKIVQNAGDAKQAPALLSKADYIVLSLYPTAILPWLQAHRAYFKPGALLTDLAGVKGCFVHEAQTLLAPWHEFIACHPMAGREVSGIQNAADTLFHGANFIITPTERNTKSGLEFAHELAGILHFGHITEISPEHHDEIVAYVSQLTHALAVCLMNANSDPQLPEVTGDSFRDLTRIANMNAPLWSELFLANAPALLRQIDRFSNSLQELRECLLQNDKSGLVSLFENSTRRRLDFGARDETTASKEK